MQALVQGMSTNLPFAFRPPLAQRRAQVFKLFAIQEAANEARYLGTLDWSASDQQPLDPPRLDMEMQPAEQT